jgi:Zn-dependent protease
MSVGPPPTGNTTDPAASKAPPPPPPQENVWAFRIATVAGIPIRVHFTFLLFLFWVGVGWRGGGGTLGVLRVLAVFACVVLHELGHGLVARRYGIPVGDITLYPIGGIARIEKRLLPVQELAITIAGPAVNIVIAAVLGVVLLATGGMLPAAVTTVGGGGWRGFVQVVMFTNILLALFNLIPAFPMDGGRVLRAILALNMAPERATAFAANIGQFIAILIGAAAFLTQPPNWLFLFIALFVYIGAGQEAVVTRQSALVEGVPVSQAMITDMRTLTVGNTLKEAADVLLDTSQHDFPILHGEEVQGVLTRNGLLRALAQEGPGGYVAGAMNRHFLAAGPEDDLAELLPLLQNEPGPLLVLEPGPTRRLLGMVTGDNVAEFFAVRQIVAARNRSERPRSS